MNSFEALVAGRKTEGRERLASDLARWSLGPFHPALPGAVKLHLEIDGEHIVRAAFETGFLHRGVEGFIQRRSWLSAIPYVDRIDPEDAAGCELAYSLAIEQLAGIEVSERGDWIRIVVLELGRLSSLLGYLSRVALSCGGETMAHYLLRDRERVLDLLELLTGARFSFCFIRPGGVSADVTDGFLERVLETCELMRLRLKEYNDLFSYNQSFFLRARKLGVLDRGRALLSGISGPSARASGLNLDERKRRPYGKYSRLDFEPFAVDGGHADFGSVHLRYLLRLREISQSLDLLKQAVEAMPSGAHASEAFSPAVKLPIGEAAASVEGARGIIHCRIRSDGGERPERVSFSGPSVHALSAIEAVLPGTRVEDLPLIVASFDPCISEVDR